MMEYIALFSSVALGLGFFAGILTNQMSQRIIDKEKEEKTT